MDALDVISVDQAKAWLGGVEDDDAVIERVIKSAIHWVEKYTSYRLYERQIILHTYVFGQGFPYFPISIDSVKNQSGVDIAYTTTNGTSDIYVHAPKDSTIIATVGYAEADIAEIPPPLIEAAYKMITYIYDNRDMYQVVAPTDVQIMLNQYRRSATI